MKIGIVLDAIVDGLIQLGILKEITVLDQLCDLGEILVDDTACADVHVTDLRVTHLSVGKTDKHTGGIAFYKRVLCLKRIHHRCLRHGNCIAILTLADAIAVKYH